MSDHFNIGESKSKAQMSIVYLKRKCLIVLQVKKRKRPVPFYLNLPSVEHVCITANFKVLSTFLSYKT